MSPRAYQLGRRQATIEDTRARILAATRDLLAGEGDLPPFTIDNVARRAEVARMTVYYQYESKRGLIEALSDELARRGLVAPLKAAFHHADPAGALDAFVAAFCGFWASDRLVIRRIRALAALDADVRESVRSRDARRRHGARVILERLSRARGTPSLDALENAADVVHALTSFELFDVLADAERGADGACLTMQHLVRASLAP
jgi:AcrR family transcriptional regulator